MSAARIAAGRFAVRFAIGTTGRAGLGQPVLEPSLPSERFTSLWALKEGAIAMAIFDRDDLSGNDMRPERGYPSDVRSKAPAWIAGIVIVAAIIGVFAYKSQSGRPPRSRANPRRGASARPVGDTSAASGSQFTDEAVTGFREPAFEAGSYFGFRRSRRRRLGRTARNGMTRERRISFPSKSPASNCRRSGRAGSGRPAARGRGPACRRNSRRPASANRRAADASRLRADRSAAAR